MTEDLFGPVPEAEETLREARDAFGRFVAGNSGGAGRPRGARNKLAAAFLEALHEDFLTHGRGAIAETRKDKPEAYLRLLVAILPKDFSQRVSDYDELSDAELDRRIVSLAASLADAFGESGIGGAAAREGAEVRAHETGAIPPLS
jgi:hypothetical protein